MQKKLIALAVAGMVAAPVAMAQSNVTIYGIMDAAISSSSSSYAGDSNRTGLDFSQENQSGSRIGFRGTEDLGNGLKASFVIEQGIIADTGESAQGGRTFGRQTFVALSGGFGTVSAGRQYSPQFVFVGAVDPFGLGTVGDVSFTGMYKLTASGRLDNLLAYTSPDMSGFRVAAGYTGNAVGNETGQDGDLRALAISPTYRNGPLFVGLNYHRVDIKGFSDDNNVLDIGGTYDFGVVKIAALYGMDEIDNIRDSRRWMVGATVPVSEAGSVMVSYSREKDKELAGDPEAGKWALGYDHMLSTRTNMYAVVGYINKNDDDRFAIRNSFERSVQVGLRHRF